MWFCFCCYNSIFMEVLEIVERSYLLQASIDMCKWTLLPLQNKNCGYKLFSFTVVSTI